MRSQDGEKMILGAGIAVLTVSLAVPAFHKLAELHEVRYVASRVADVPRLLMASGKPGKTLSVQVQNLVDGLAPDAALAKAKMRDGKAAETVATPLMSEKKGEAGEAAGNENGLKVLVGWSGADGAEAQRPGQKRSWSFPAQ